MLRFFGKVLVAGLLVWFLAGAAQAQAATPPTVSGYVDAAHGLTLHKQEWNENAGPFHCRGFSQPPDNVSGIGAFFCIQPSNPFQTVDASLSFRYTITSDFDDQRYSVIGNAKVPLAGTSTVGCDIVITGTNRTDDNAPYTCIAKWRGDTTSNDPGIDFEVDFKPTEVVTSPVRQGELMSRLCGPSLPEGVCRYLPSTLTEDVKAPAVKASADFANCTTKEADYTKAWKHSESVEDSFGVTVSGEVVFKTPIGKVTAGLELSYEHKWGHEDEQSGEAKITLDPGEAGTFWHAAVYDVVTGDFVLVDKSAIYQFKDVRYAFPNRAGDQGALVARTQKADCGKQPPGATAPCLDGDADSAAPSCVSPTPARVDAAACLTGAFTDGTCPPPSQLTDLDQAWPPSWADDDGRVFTHWDSVSSGEGSVAGCPPGSAVADGPSGSRSGDDGTQAWLTCTTTGVSALRAGGRGAAVRATTAAASAKRTVYLSLPLGARADRAPRDMAAAARLAFSDHAPRGVALRVLSEADRAGRPSAGRARDNARRAARDPRALAFVGGAQSSEAAAALPILHRAGLLMVSPSSTALGLTTDRRYRGGRGPTFARIVPNDFNQAAALARRIQSEGVRRVVVVRDGSAYGRDLARLFEVAARHRGLTIASQGRMGEGPARLARRAAAAHAGAVLYAGEADNGALGLVRAIVAKAPGVEVYGGDGLAGNDAFLRAAHRTGAESRLRVVGTALAPDTLPARGIALYRRLTVALGHAPNAFAVNGYEAMAATLAAIERAGAPGRGATVRAFLATHGRRSPLGTYSIDRNGDTTLGSYGEFTVVGGELTASECVGCPATG